MTQDSQGEFDRAHMRAFFDEIRSHLSGHPTELLSFDEIKAKLRLKDESYRGLQDIPLDRIVGSVGRFRDFTSTFLPKSRAMRDRWARIHNQVNGLQGLPPIDVFQVDDVYFVRDGNHRVSVARQLGFPTIEAHVTELATPIDLEPGMTKRELNAAAAYGHFLETSGLGNARSAYAPIKLTDPARYNDLLMHIEITKQMLEHRWGEPVNQHDASLHWFDHVYQPTITLIRKYDVLRYIPRRTSSRTEADLYMWAVEYLWALRREYGPGGGEYTISAALMEFLDKNGVPIPAPLIHENDKPLFE